MKIIRMFKTYVFLMSFLLFSMASMNAVERTSPTMQTKEIITFDDPVFEFYFRGILRQDTGDITSDLVKACKRLDFNNIDGTKDNITKLTPLKYFKNLEILDIQNNKVNDITPISNLKMLKELVLSGNTITNLEPLSKLTNLKKLNLFYTPITDIAALSKLPLEELNIGRCPALDIKPLYGKQSLTLLWLNLNNFADTTVIKSLVNLKTLTIMSCNVNDLEFIRPLTKLENLIADRNNFSDLSPLRSLTHLKTLIISNTKIKDLSVLETLYNQGCFRGRRTFQYHISVENCNLDLRPGTNNRRIIDMLVGSNVIVGWQKGNIIE